MYLIVSSDPDGYIASLSGSTRADVANFKDQPVRVIDETSREVGQNGWYIGKKEARLILGDVLPIIVLPPAEANDLASGGSIDIRLEWDEFRGGLIGDIIS